MLYEGRSGLTNESTQSVANFTSFLKLLKEFRFLKKQISFLSILASTITQGPKYTWKATLCTFYAISQHKMYLLIRYNPNKSWVTAILR